MESTKFDCEEDEELINLVRENPVLYDFTHEHHKSFEVKTNVWKKIAEILERDGECFCTDNAFSIVFIGIAAYSISIKLNDTTVSIITYYMFCVCLLFTMTTEHKFYRVLPCFRTV